MDFLGDSVEKPRGVAVVSDGPVILDAENRRLVTERLGKKSIPCDRRSGPDHIQLERRAVKPWLTVIAPVVSRRGGGSERLVAGPHPVCCIHIHRAEESVPWAQAPYQPAERFIRRHSVTIESIGEVVMTETEHRITEIVRDAVRGSSENRLRGFDDETAWGDPLVGFAAGDDPLFHFLKEDIGEFYWTPKEIFELTFGTGPAAGDLSCAATASGSSVAARTASAVAGPAPTGPGPAAAVAWRRETRDLSVVAWVLPQTAATKADQRQESQFPAERWISSRAYWNELSENVHTTVVARLATMGLRAVAPELSSHWRTEESPRYGRASTWSQRHTAFVAGLGTFGLSDGLITPVGKAMRAGSVVVEAALAPSPRRYDGHHDWCPFYVDGTCEDCLRRCPAGAITKAGHDKVKCEVYLRRLARRTKPVIGDRTGGCGLCQAGVRCESGIPESIRPRGG